MGKIKKRGKKEHLVFMREKAVQMREKKKMPKPKLKEKNIGNYSKVDIESALQMIKSGTAIRKAGKSCNIPYPTLRRYVINQRKLGDNIPLVRRTPYSNAERQRRHREKRKADKINAYRTFSQSSDVQPQQEQPEHDDPINKRQPQSSAERQRKYRKKQQQKQQMGDTSSIRKLRNVDQAELARKRELNKQRQSRFRARQRYEWPSTPSHQEHSERYGYNPKRLAVLCERVLKKYKLLPAEQTPEIDPSDYFLVGGKPLRKRKEDKQKTTSPDGKPIKKRGRPKSQKEVEKKASGRSTPIKLETDLFTSSPASENNDAEFEEESVFIKMEELDIPPDDDPFAEETSDFFVGIKEEFPYNEEHEEKHLIEADRSVSETNILMPTLVPTLKPGQPSTSTGNTGVVPVISVILDDIQIFANSVAEQLRAMPVNRALLLQLDIQNMLDNEKQIMMHEG